MQTKFSPDEKEKNYSFDDVQGIDEAKEEVQEIVEFLKYPEKFKRLGAKLPTGAEDVYLHARLPPIFVWSCAGVACLSLSNIKYQYFINFTFIG